MVGLDALRSGHRVQPHRLRVLGVVQAQRKDRVYRGGAVEHARHGPEAVLVPAFQRGDQQLLLAPEVMKQSRLRDTDGRRDVRERHPPESAVAERLRGDVQDLFPADARWPTVSH